LIVADGDRRAETTDASGPLDDRILRSGFARPLSEGGMEVGVTTDGSGLGTLINSRLPLGTDRPRRLFFDTFRRLTNAEKE
jgi:hypothetical protein